MPTNRPQPSRPGPSSFLDCAEFFVLRGFSFRFWGGFVPKSALTSFFSFTLPFLLLEKFGYNPRPPRKFSVLFSCGPPLAVVGLPLGFWDFSLFSPHTVILVSLII